eukprot:15446154-Alexandrium_andersonii.AAC.1
MGLPDREPSRVAALPSPLACCSAPDRRNCSRVLRPLPGFDRAKCFGVPLPAVSMASIRGRIRGRLASRRTSCSRRSPTDVAPPRAPGSRTAGPRI